MFYWAYDMHVIEPYSYGHFKYNRRLMLTIGKKHFVMNQFTKRHLKTELITNAVKLVKVFYSNFEKNQKGLNNYF